MESEIKDLNFVFNEMPIYSKETFNIFCKDEKGIYKVNETEINRFLNYINTKSGKIITNCVWCDKEFSFNYCQDLYTIVCSYIRKDKNIRIASFDVEDLYISLENERIGGQISRKILENDLIEKNYYMTYYINCNNIPKHIYSLYLFIKVQRDKIIVTKIGQYPSTLSVKGFDFDKYANQLKKYNAYDDYKNADLSMSNNFYAGAYTYLRRVYEKQLNFYIDKDKPQLSDNRTETKIKAVKGNFDPRIHTHLKNLYGILSIGIHELDEDESKDYYEYLKAMIDMQLQFEKMKDEEEKQSKTLNTKISNIVDKLKQRK